MALYRLPLHLWAERVESVLANRMIFPQRTALELQEKWLIRQMIQEVRNLRNDVLKSPYPPVNPIFVGKLPTTSEGKIAIAWQSGTVHLQGPRNNSAT